MYVAACYLSYLAISIALTVWVARTLHHSGRVFLLNAFHGTAPLVEAFHGNSTLVRAVTQLLDVGFYLMSFGWVATSFRSGGMSTSYIWVEETVCEKLGGFLLMMGFVHLFNMLLLALFRRKAGSPAVPASV